MFWLSKIPTISSVRRKLSKIDSEMVFTVHYQDNDAPEGHDDNFEILVQRRVVRCGPDCDGTVGYEEMFIVSLKNDFAFWEKCSLYADNDNWRMVIGVLLGRSFGFYYGKEQGNREADSRWIEALSKKS